MHQRGQESPMDFQWENSSGRVDPRSPFTTMSTLTNTLTQETPSKSNAYRGCSSSGSLGTPSKSSVFTTPYKFAAPPKFGPITPQRTKPEASSSFLFHSPGSATLPEDENDNDSENEVRTSEISRSLRRVNNRSVPTTPARVTGRGELRRGKHYDGAIIKSRRKRNQRLLGPGSEDGEDSDNDEYQTPLGRRARRFPSSIKSSTEDWVATHRNIPLIISDYLQLIVNGVLLMVCLYMVYGFIITIRNDIDQKVQEISSEIVQHMASCSKSYIENRCAPDIRVPAMEIQCSAWEMCMNRDPEKIGRAKVSAQTFAEIVNSFVNNISYKTMFFTSFVILGSFLASNFAFGYLRGRALDSQRPYPLFRQGDSNQSLRPSELVSMYLPLPSTWQSET
ncbi:Di-sulfide bridge nucleocytoplasmic transport domain-containing protein [Geopyxis carbonaria]|nr:Di-sulfide bridge nucleocytoplasmic transport domain-containing protein [Geopyxis carbonaria]